MHFSDLKDGALELTQNKTRKKLRILAQDEAGNITQLGVLIDRIKNRPRKISSLYLISTPQGARLTHPMLRKRFEAARDAAAKHTTDAELAERIRLFQFRDIRPKAASETDLSHASKLLGHTDKQITRTVYQRVGETVMPTK
jgi:integrase